MIMNDDKLREYQQQVAQILVRDYFSETNLEITTPVVIKNNNVQLYGINIKEKDKNFAPTFYVENYFEKGFEPEAAAQEIYNINPEREGYDIAQFQIDQLKEFDKCKDNICYKIVNRQKNPDIIDNCPSIPIAPDLMIVFYLQITEDSTCIIHNELTNIWGLTDDVEKTLFEIADHNTEQLHPVSFQSLAATMSSVIPEVAWEKFEEANPPFIPMYVLTNDEGLQGASTILYRNGQQLKDCFEEISARYQVNDVFIIPSSIHEWLLVPALPHITKEELQSVCQNVNQTQIQDTEFLSDNIFSFDENNGFQQITFTDRNMQLSR